MTDITDRELIDYLDTLNPLLRITTAPQPSPILMAREILHLRQAIRDKCANHCAPCLGPGRHTPECLIYEIEN